MKTHLTFYKGLLGIFFVMLFLTTAALAQQGGYPLANSSKVSSNTSSVEKSSLRTLSEDGVTYTASNGTVYKKGEKIILGAGKGGNGSFLHISIMMFGTPTDSMPMTKDGTGGEFEIIEFKKDKLNKRIFAVIKDGAKFGIYLESALAAGEIK